MTESEPTPELDPGELLDEPDELGPEGAADLDLNGCNDFEFVP